MKEKLIRQIVELIFIVRYWVVVILMAALGLVTYYVGHLPGVEIRDTVAVFTGGAVLVTVFYHVINYEYTQRKFKYDIKSSKDILSFKTALEWQKEHFQKNLNILRNFHLQYKILLEDGTPRKFQEELDKPENDDAYNALLCVLNFLESVCLGVKQGIMDEDFIKGFFSTVFLMQYNRYISYIEYRRKEQQNPRIWENFTYLAKKWLICQ